MIERQGKISFEDLPDAPKVMLLVHACPIPSAGHITVLPRQEPVTDSDWG